MSKYEFELFADYYQFYIQDDNTELGDLSDAWTEDAVENLLAVSNGVVGIGTVRNMDVTVQIVVQTTPPNLNEPEFDRINKTSIDCSTGTLVIAGCTDYFPDAERIALVPGVYGVTIGYKNLNDVSEDGLDGNDSYHIWLYDE